jgi:DNA-binding GntR family transcriptional regulator
MSTVDALYGNVKQEILSGRHVPGTVLRQIDIANRFGVSRIPLREAFSRLEAEGLLTLRPRRGYAVSEYNVEEINEIFELRALVEEHAGRLAATTRSQQDVDAVISLADQMAQIKLEGPESFDQWCRLNLEFHQRIISACKRRHVIKVALQLRDLVEPYIRLETSISGDDAEANLEHARIAAAFRDGDARLVGSLSALHCYHTRDRLIALIKQSTKLANAKQHGAKQQ